MIVFIYLGSNNEGSIMNLWNNPIGCGYGLYGSLLNPTYGCQYSTLNKFKKQPKCEMICKKIDPKEEQKKKTIRNYLIGAGLIIAAAYLTYKGHNVLKTGSVKAKDSAKAISNFTKEHIEPVYRTGHGIHDVVTGIRDTVLAPIHLFTKKS